MGCPLPNGGRPRHTNSKIEGCTGVAALSQQKKTHGAHNNCTGFTVCLIGSDTVDAQYFLVFTCFLTALKFLCIREPVIIYVEEGRGKKRTGGGGSRLFHIGKRGRGAKLFCKEV